MSGLPTSIATSGSTDALVVMASVPAAGGPKGTPPIQAQAAPGGGGGGSSSGAVSLEMSASGADSPPGPQRAKDVSDLAYQSENLKQGQVVEVNGTSYEVLDSVYDPKTGLNAVTVMDPDGRIGVGFGGTAELRDLRPDMQNYFNGPSAQYDQSAAYLKSIRGRYPDASMYTSGHSLGGGLATYAAAMNGMPGAGVNSATLGTHYLDRVASKAPRGAEARIVNYNHWSDPVAMAPDLARSGALPRAGATGRQLGVSLYTVPRDTQRPLGLLDSHLLNNLNPASVFHGTTPDGRKVVVIAAPDGSLVGLPGY